jgi:hypothetical protein
MSLTSHIEDPTSPIHDYFIKMFPNTKEIAIKCTKRLRDFSLKKPSHTQNPRLLYLIGHAVDYRIRFAYNISDVGTLVAAQGLRMLKGSPYLKKPLKTPYRILECEGIGVQFFAYVHLWLRLHAPLHRLDMKEEDECMRICYVLSLFESVFRSGSRQTALFEPTIKSDVASLLAIPTDDEMEDMLAIVKLFFDTCSDWLDTPTILNPTFEGSKDVGGADADIIMEGCLYEIKTVMDMKYSKWFRQLVGYVALDYRDQYNISKVGIYFSRSGCTISWDCNEFLSLLSNGSIQTIQECRAHFKNFLNTIDRSML